MIMTINLIGFAIIGFIIWWFWLSTPSTTKAVDKVVDILVDNGTYSPARIEVKQDSPLMLRFTRKDASPCAEKVVFDELNISEDLPVDKPVEIFIPTDKKGEFEFTCQMKMYRGSLKII